MDNVVKGKNYRFTVLSEILIRMEYSETGVFIDDCTELVRNRKFNKVNFKRLEDERFLVIETDYFKLEYIKNKSFYGTKLVPEQNLKVMLKGTDKYWHFNHVEARNFKTIGYSLDNIENISINTKGLYSTDGFVSIDDSKSLILRDNTFYKRSVNNIDTYLFMYNRSFGLVLRDYFTLTGKPNMIPRYMFGNIWNKDEYYTDQNIKDLINKFNKNNIPINYILLGNNWHKKSTGEYGLSWNNDLFIDYSKFIKYLRDLDVYLGVTINPIFISNKENNFNEFITNKTSENKDLIPLNIYNKNIMDSYFDTFISPLMKNGIDGILIDYNNIKDLTTLRVLNYYHNEYFKNNKLKTNILSRNSLINSHLTNINYTGKTIVSWKVLERLPEYITSACNNGISFVSNDIGGFHGGIEDDELYRRYVQYGVFSPILRLSSAGSKYYKREPWNWDVHTLSIVTYYLRLRNMLIPYIYTESFNYTENLIPLIRPLYYEYPEIYDEVDYRNEYYFGSSLLISPITKPKDLVMNRTIHKIFLPDGIWYDFKNGNKYNGNRRYVLFYKDEDYPVFVRQGSIIPLAIINEDNINSTKNPDGFEINVFPGKTNTYTIYEDDGITTNKNNYVKTIIDYNYMANNYTLIIRHDISDSSLIASIRSYKIKFRNTRLPNDIAIYVGEERLENFKYYLDENDFVIELNKVNSYKQITINCKGQDIEIETSRLINKDIDDILSDLKIETILKSEISKIMFSDLEVGKKRIEIRKLKKRGLHPRYINMFLKLLEYISENV